MKEVIPRFAAGILISIFTITGNGLDAVGQSAPLTYSPGKGVTVDFPDQQAKAIFLGYIQGTYNYYSAEENGAVSNEFFVRRARLDFIFRYRDRYEIFFEFDGAGTSRTQMVLAQIDVQYQDGHFIRAGKFITPFSPENNRSSQGLSTVERYSALNSLFLLPAFDTQFGVMLFGRFRNLDYYLSVTNGNASASANSREHNNHKDIQLRFSYPFTDVLRYGLSFYRSVHHSQSLQLVGHSFSAFNRALITGRRYGLLADSEWHYGNWHTRGELFLIRFDEPLSIEHQLGWFYGSYSELGYMLRGDYHHGHQLIGRLEAGQFFDRHSSLEGTSRLYSLMVGHNWYADGIFRLQTNFIYHRPDQPSDLPDSRYQGENGSFEILIMLQLRF
ncbi:MAG: porin [Balneolales bacterium]